MKSSLNVSKSYPNKNKLDKKWNITKTKLRICDGDIYDEYSSYMGRS